MRYWFKLIYQNQRKRIFIGAMWALFTALSGVALLLLSGWFITATAITGLTISAGLLAIFDMYMPGSGIRFFALSRTIGRYMERVYNHDTILRLISVYRVSLFSHLSDIPLRDVRSIADSEWLGRLTADLDALDSILLRYTIPLIATALLLILLTVFVGFFWFQLMFPLAIFLIGCFLITIHSSVKYTRDHASLTTEILSYSRNDIIEHLKGAYELNVADLMHAHEKKLIERLDALYLTQTRLNNRTANIQLCLDSVLGIGLVAIIGASLYAVNLGLITGPVAVMVIMMLVGISELLQMLPTQFSSWGKTHFSANRLRSLTIDNLALSQREVSTLQRIEVHVYDNPKLLKSKHQSVFFKLERYQLLSIQGRSGVGKSTLAGLLVGIEPLDENNLVTVNGDIHLGDIATSHWYTKIAYLEQSNTLLSGSLEYNLKLSSAAYSDWEIREVLKLVELDDWASALSQGLNTWLGETGSNVSGGQARRICLARLLLRDPQLIILDEPFNGIDDAMASRIWANIYPWLAKRMTVLLTHASPAYLQDYSSIQTLDLD